jgi:uncharacterized protein
MNENDIISTVRTFAIQNSEQDDIHGFGHVERVYNTCVQIGKKLKANLLVLKISALLHDIGRISEEIDPLKRNHADISAEKALEYLKSSKFKISQEDISNIVHCIKAHSFSNTVIPQTIEARILSYSDKLDAIGAVGLYRTIGFTVKNKGGLEQVIEHLENKIMKLKNLFYLDISKEIAKKRHYIIEEFYKKIKEEK